MKREPVILGGRAERERLLDRRREGGAGRGERNPVADTQDRGKVDRCDRPPRGQVFVELEWAHGLRERSPHMGHEADVRCGDESRRSGRSTGGKTWTFGSPASASSGSDSRTGPTRLTLPCW